MCLHTCITVHSVTTTLQLIQTASYFIAVLLTVISFSFLFSDRPWRPFSHCTALMMSLSTGSGENLIISYHTLAALKGKKTHTNPTKNKTTKKVCSQYSLLFRLFFFKNLTFQVYTLLVLSTDNSNMYSIWKIKSR